MQLITAKVTGSVGKNSGARSHATSRDDIREAHTILKYCFTDSLFSLLN